MGNDTHLESFFTMPCISTQIILHNINLVDLLCSPEIQQLINSLEKRRKDLLNIIPNSVFTVRFRISIDLAQRLSNGMKKYSSYRKPNKQFTE